MLSKRTMIILILIVSLFSVSTVSATDNLTTDNIVSDDEGTVISSSNDILTSFDAQNLSSSPKSFSDLNDLISGTTSLNVYLDSDYAFSKDSDSAFANGIPINRAVNIYGNGHTIDGANQARIFIVSDSVSSYLSFNNINFINANSNMGSAIYGNINTAACYCSFNNNHATDSGGAMYNGVTYDCTFTGNSASKCGGAMYRGNAERCTFIANSAQDGGATYNVYVTYSNFINNTALSSCGAMYGSSAAHNTFTGNYARDHSGAFGFGYALNCTFISNHASYSGALGGEGSSAEDCTFKYNTAETGGAIFGCLAKNCVFIGNLATDGGGAMAGGNSAQDCVFTQNSATNQGGALLGVYALRCTFTANHANEGGAMYLNSAKDCKFINNSAVRGGAMFNSHALSSNFTGNTAHEGGAICDGSAQSCQFRYNSATNGGAMAGGSAEGSALACTFLSNTASEYGGAIYATSAIRCYFRANSAKFGGAISSGSSASESVFIDNVAKISGGAKYESYAGNCNFTGNLPVYKLYVSDFNAVEGFGGDLSIRLADSPDYFVTGDNVTIKVYNSKNKLVGTYKAQTGYNWFVDLDAGKYKAVISVDEDVYGVDPVKITITIKKSTSIYVVNVVTYYNAGKCLLVNLHDSKGNVIKYAPVSININGVTRTYTTDENGQVIVSTNGLAPKTYVATIKYAGDANYVQSSATAKITVKKVNPKFIAAKATFKVKLKTKSYSVVLKNNKNVVIKSAKVTLKVNGITYSAKTNAYGKAIFKITKLNRKGIFVATIRYAGNAYYNAISKSVQIVVRV